MPKQPNNDDIRRATDAPLPAGDVDATPVDRRSDDRVMRVGNGGPSLIEGDAPVAAATSGPWFWGRSFFGQDAFTNSAADRKEMP